MGVDEEAAATNRWTEGARGMREGVVSVMDV